MYVCTYLGRVVFLNEAFMLNKLPKFGLTLQCHKHTLVVPKKRPQGQSFEADVRKLERLFRFKAKNK
jgi:hypothetical protein